MDVRIEREEDEAVRRSCGIGGGGAPPVVRVGRPIVRWGAGTGIAGVNAAPELVGRRVRDDAYLGDEV